MGAADLLVLNLTEGGAAEEEAAEIKRSVLRGAGLTRQLLAFSRRQATRPQLLTLNDVVTGMDTMLRRLIGPEIEFEIALRPDAALVQADPSQIEQVVLNLVVNSRDAMPTGGKVNVKLGTKEYPLEDAKNPSTLAHSVRYHLTDEKRSLRVYGSQVVVGRLTASGGHARLHLINYASANRKVDGIRVRVLGQCGGGWTESASWRSCARGS